LQIIDNLLNEHAFNDIKKETLGDQFPWYRYLIDSNGEDQFGHQFIHYAKSADHENELTMTLFGAILRKLKPYYLLEVKACMTIGGHTLIENGYHTDFGDNITNHKTAIFYFNTNDGYTIFEDSGEKVESVENRIIIFDGNRRHSDTNTTSESRQVILNINYF
jgi:hypothetical protein